MVSMSMAFDPFPQFPDRLLYSTCIIVTYEGMLVARLICNTHASSFSLVWYESQGLCGSDAAVLSAGGSGLTRRI